MSQTMSGPSDWLQFYNQNLSTNSPAPVDSRVSDATVVTTTVTSPTTLTPLASNTGHLSPEGRVSKPVRRRSRASRRTPTTLLNTDTTNFRAMVQQFTGGPTAPFASAPSFATFGLGGGRQPQLHNPTAIMLPPAGHGYHHLQTQQQQQQLYQQQYMFSLSNNNNNGHGEGFFQRRPNNIGASDGFVIDGVSSSSQVAPPGRPSTSSDENRSNSFMF